MKHLRRAVDHVVIINDGLAVCNRALVRLVRFIDPCMTIRLQFR